MFFYLRPGNVSHSALLGRVWDPRCVLCQSPRLGFGGFECKRIPWAPSRTALGLMEPKRMRPYHGSARQPLFGASDPGGRRRLGSPQVHELPNFYLCLGSHPADAKPVVHVGGEETNVRAARLATSQVIGTKLFFFPSSFERKSSLPSTTFLGCTFMDVCRQTHACPACAASCLTTAQLRSWKPRGHVSMALCLLGLHWCHL